MNKDLAIKLFDTLKDKLGMSQHFDTYPELEFDDELHFLSGEFRDDYNAIILYPLALTNEEELKRTLVHEYKHYLQDPVLFEQYKETYDYYDNPFEIEAYKFEENYKTIFSDEYSK